MKPSHSLKTLLAVLAVTSMFNPAAAESVRGVNPADIDSRFDVIGKRIRLEHGGHLDAITFKLDKKLHSNWGLNFELPTYSRLHTSGQAIEGNGDLYARARWISPQGAWTYGLSLETVLPTASRDALGTGRYQFNVGLLAARAFSPTFLAAGVLRQISSAGGDSARAGFDNTETRLIPVWILPQGWAISGELRQTWEHRTHQSWQRVEGSLSKQLNVNLAITGVLSRDFGDKPDRGAVTLALKYFY